MLLIKSLYESHLLHQNAKWKLNLKTKAHINFHVSIWACEKKETIFATQHIVVKQQLAEVHSRM